jgi:hypothetical protein
LVGGQGKCSLNLIKVISNEKAPAVWRERKKRDTRRGVIALFSRNKFILI